MTRSEVCVCRGEPIVAEDEYGLAVCHHNGTPVHQAWRRYREAGDSYAIALLDYDPRRHWPTADDEPVDSVQGDVGASADGVEGAA